jgi:phosphatidylserine/phosphatidylglycerophosphate/cardiolipin synthase-like enzyme
VLHHKFVVLDGALLMTGSYNYSQNAELYNFENDLFSAAPGEVAAYGGEFAAVWDQAHAPAAGELPAPKSL